jgi:hypothetical protein
MRASTSWNPQGLSRPVLGLLLPVTVRGVSVCTVHKSVSCRERIMDYITITSTSHSIDFLERFEEESRWTSHCRNYVYVCAYIYIICTYNNTYICICIYMYVYTYVCVCVHIYIYYGRKISRERTI